MTNNFILQIQKFRKYSITICKIFSNLWFKFCPTVINSKHLSIHFSV